MNSGPSKNLNSSGNNLQQKQLEHFGITSNSIQGKGKGKDTTFCAVIQDDNLSTKRIRDESIESKIADILQELEGLSGQALLRRILENKSYTLYDDNKHVYCQICQKPITLHRFNDGTRLKEHIITPTHIEKSQKTIQETGSKKIRTTFLTTFFSKTDENNNMQANNIDLTEPVKKSQKLLGIASKTSEKHGMDK